MAVATIRPVGHKRSTPDDGVVYREYVHQTMVKGEYGAFSRTARVCGMSHEHVRRVVARHGPKPPEPSELAYEPAPGEVEFATLVANEALLRQLLAVEAAPAAPDLLSTPRSVAPALEPEVAPPELDYLQIPYTFGCTHLPDRSYENLCYDMWLVATVTLILTIIDILVSYKSFGLSLLLLPEVVAMWWVVAQWRRLLAGQRRRRNTRQRH